MELYLNFCSKKAKADSIKTATSSLGEEVRGQARFWSLVGGAGRAPTGPLVTSALVVLNVSVSGGRGPRSPGCPSTLTVSLLASLQQ